jgi:hypothetical protein
MEFINGSDTFYINYNCTIITYNGTVSNVTKVAIFNESVGNFTTDLYRVKFNNGILNLYDKNSVLINTFRFSQYTNVINSNKIDLLVKSFTLKANYIIELYQNNNTDNTANSGTGNPDYYIINNGQRETVIKVIGRGSDTEYTTDQNNILVVSKRFNCKFNGIPIGIN